MIMCSYLEAGLWIGLLLVKKLARGASWIGVSEPSSNRRQVALKLSATATFDPLSTDVATETNKATNDRGADIVFDCAGVQGGLDTAIAAVRTRGKIINIATWENTSTFNVNKLMAKEAVYTAVIGYDNVFPQIMEALREGHYDGTEALITKKIPLEDVVEKDIRALVQEKDTQSKQ
ncbi:hypothetical protein OBBRIDRAFT_546988 [Obba rivulosa]|uniref:Alcohol dehydrogenase-like C-terminal domain-containing protein n=1 Tax=Obba rivulosa TaxID=1052685 RepID=A0A8E2AV63_9APHY|nr:hypothetical protein OBBRIDRAFT_546988 [Obba rivulosa]